MIKELSYEAVSKAINSLASKHLTDLNIKSDNITPAYMQLSNYLSKRIDIQPRVVTESSQFNVPNEFKQGFQILKSKILKGDDLNPYLSKFTLNPLFSDRFFDDYGCFHFHLGDVIDNDGFIKRTGPVALAFVTSKEVFFIETKMHGKGFANTWTNKSVLEVLHNEKPNLIFNQKVSLLKDVSPQISNEDEILNLRKKGYSFGVTLDDGSVYMPATFGQVTVMTEQKMKGEKGRNSTLAATHMLRMMNYTRSIHIPINQYIKEFKIKNNCTITHIEIVDLKSNSARDLLNLSQFRLNIYFLKGFQMRIHSNLFFH
ncbi:hypothetical protein [Acinetobacter entericus]|uniref:Uncharacterized protein n=1 Tax=Acinetobacter entericus TaxID=2989714 RepID=A0ABT3NEI3_9GAMM|nr:hypothetical protein [Acinetobacter entericus]MCW8037933.1 hypothetical protein [Acinetobacter entericus]